LNEGRTLKKIKQAVTLKAAPRDFKEGWIEHYWEKMKAAFGR